MISALNRELPQIVEHYCAFVTNIDKRTKWSARCFRMRLSPLLAASPGDWGAKPWIGLSPVGDGSPPIDSESPW